MQGDQHQPLPPELDWSNMKDGIFDKIQSIEQQETSQTSDSFAGKRSLLLLLLFELAFILFLLSQPMVKDLTPEAAAIVHLPETDLNRRASTDIEKARPTNQIAFFADSLIEPDQIMAAKSTLSSISETSSPLSETGIAYIMSEVPDLQPSILGIFDPISQEKTDHYTPDIRKMDSAYNPFVQPIKSRNQLILEGGINFWDEGYGNTEPERAQYEVPLSSFQLQGYYMKAFRRNYFLMAGLQYQQLESRFEYNSTIQDYKITLKDTIIQVRKNLLTGDETILRGDVEQYVQAERRVRHYNKIQLLKASVGIGKSWRFHSFQTDVYLGGALNGLVQNQGRTLHQDTILDYNGTSNSLFQNQLTLDGILGARLHYYLNPKIGLTTGLQVQKSLMNWSMEDNIAHYPTSFSLQLGLSYSL